MGRRKSSDGVYLRGTVWWLDFQHEGTRYQFRLGKGISKTVAKELAKAKRGEVLKGEAGIGRKRHDLGFDKAAEIFIQWACTNKRPQTAVFYEGCLKQLSTEFGKRRLVPRIFNYYTKSGSPCVSSVRWAKRAIDSRIWSADLVHLNGFGSSLWASR